MITSHPQPPISVIVCTRDRPESLVRCLAALQQLVYPHYEVIVVDNASRSTATAQVVNATPFRCVREERPGLNWARNRGIAEARYDLIAYIDDDALADPQWLNGIAATFADPSIAAVTGRVLAGEYETPAQHLFEQYGGMSKGPQARIFHRSTMQPREIIAAHHAGVGANMAFRRSTFARIGTFDTALDVGTPSCGGGDLDIFHRVMVAGLKLRYEPRATAYHLHRREMDALQRQISNNGRSFGVYLLKIWTRGDIPRSEVARFTAGWVGGWLLARMAQRLTGRLDFPLPLIWAEVWGALHAPASYIATYRHDRRIRRAAA